MRDKFGGLYAMKDFLSIVETPLALKISFKSATNLKCVLPTVIEIEIAIYGNLTSARDIHVLSFTNHAGKTG